MGMEQKVKDKSVSLKKPGRLVFISSPAEQLHRFGFKQTWFEAKISYTSLLPPVQ